MDKDTLEKKLRGLADYIGPTDAKKVAANLEAVEKLPEEQRTILCACSLAIIPLALKDSSYLTSFELTIDAAEQVGLLPKGIADDLPLGSKRV